MIPRASRRTATVAEIARLTERLHGVLPTALRFAEVCGDSEMTTKLTDLMRLVDRFDAACERRLRFSDLTVMLQRIEGGVRDVTRCLDVARVRGWL